MNAGATVHGFATGSLSIFHSKIYILEGAGLAWLAVGSCNLTGDGLYRKLQWRAQQPE
ncbi:MAG: hypothetical protein HYZ28_09875 [Myxococcales bacterium]|nr:hypothetical protein [Myxococcales bacterium]